MAFVFHRDKTEMYQGLLLFFLLDSLQIYLWQGFLPLSANVTIELVTLYSFFALITMVDIAHVLPLPLSENKQN